MIGSISLIPQLANKILKPILAAGGIDDGRTIKTALILDAESVQVQTAFIRSDESAAIPACKEALINAKDLDIILTKTFSGRWARGLKNTFITEIEELGIEIPEYPIQGSLTLPIRIEAQRQNNKEFTNFLAGQCASKSAMKPAADIFIQLVKETEEIE